MISSLFLKALSCEPVIKRPVWLMRQAGRYLPEYLELRKKHSLLSCFHEPHLAAQITHMPLKRFDFDAAILFSDLLVPVEVWGKTLSYPEGQGPVIEPALQSVLELHVPSRDEILQKLSYVFATIKELTPTLDVPLIGFCGAPFTLLCYLLQGKSGSGFSEVRKWIEYRREEFVQALDIVCDTCILFAVEQVKAGCSAFQIFDSWANLLSKEEFALFVLPYWKRMKLALSRCHVPVIVFSRANSLYADEIAALSPQCISFDEGRPLLDLRIQVPSHIAIQGNFSPDLLLHGTVSQVQEEALKMVRSVENMPGIIWNLGHGVLPKTPLENVEALLRVFTA